MKTVLVIRHGEKDGDELTKKGAKACEELARVVGPFEIVIASSRERTRQTARIISGKIPEVDIRAGTPDFPDDLLPTLLERELTHPLGVVGAIWEHERLVDAAYEGGLNLQQLIKATLDRLDDSQHALIVSHDGAMVGLEAAMHGNKDAPDHSFQPLQGFVVNENMSTSYFGL